MVSRECRTRVIVALFSPQFGYFVPVDGLCFHIRKTYPPAAQTIATMPALVDSFSVGHALMSLWRLGSIRAKCASGLPYTVPLSASPCVSPDVSLLCSTPLGGALLLRGFSHGRPPTVSTLRSFKPDGDLARCWQFDTANATDRFVPRNLINRRFTCGTIEIENANRLASR